MSDAPSIAAIHDALLEIDLRKQELVDVTAAVTYGAPGNYVCRLCVAGVEVSSRCLNRPLSAMIAIEGHLSDWEIIEVCNLGFEKDLTADAGMLFRQTVNLAQALKQGLDYDNIVDVMRQSAARLLDERRRHGLVPYYELRDRRVDAEKQAPSMGMAF